MEDDNAVSVQILLSQPSSIPFQIMINTVDVTADGTVVFINLYNFEHCVLWYTDRDDYIGGSIIANVSSGVLLQSFNINIVDDNIVECSEKYNVTITSVSSCGVTIGTSINSEVTITDNDSKYM